MRKAMERSLWASIRRVPSIASLEAEQLHLGNVTPPHAAPMDFGAYFDLSLDHPGGKEMFEATKIASTEYLRARLAGGSLARRPGGRRATKQLPFITTLSTEYYAVESIETLKRWWDIEPENSMDLTGVTDPSLADARTAIETAFSKLEMCAADLHGEVCEIIDELVIARPSGQQSLVFSGVSSFALWGAIAVNCDTHIDWPMYYRTIVHETAHNLLFAYARNEPLVSDDPAKRHSSPLRDDERPIDGIYHAGFVSARESMAFEKLLSCTAIGALSELEAKAIEEMLEGSVIAFWSCVQILRNEAHLTSLGENILTECENWMSANFAIELQIQ